MRRQAVLALADYGALSQLCARRGLEHDPLVLAAIESALGRRAGRALMVAAVGERRLPPEIFRLLRDLIYDYCGIFFTDDNAYIVHRRLQPRAGGARARRLRRVLPLPALVDPHARKQELEEIVDRVTTNETYFFRESYQLTAFRDEILPELYDERPRGKRLSVWSAGCSTGEEAYTIAILIQEAALFAGWDVRVFGNDISRRCLQAARRGAYGRNSFRATDEKLLRRYFREVDGKQQVRDEVRALVSFGQINLIDEQMMRLVGDVDVIFCRNVLIYFDTVSRKKVIATLHGKLMQGGYLLLGHSESLINVSTAFELVHLQERYGLSKARSMDNPKPIRILVVDDSRSTARPSPPCSRARPGSRSWGAPATAKRRCRWPSSSSPTSSRSISRCRRWTASRSCACSWRGSRRR